MPIDFPDPTISTSYTNPANGNLYTYANGSWSLTSVLAVSKGGTGLASYNRGDILFGNASGTLSTLSASTSGYVLSTNGPGADPTWIAMASAGGAGTVAAPGSRYQIAGYYPGTGASVSGSSSFTNDTSSGIVSITHATGSTSPSFGALLVSGGVGIAGTLSYFKSQLGVAGTTSLPSMAFIGNTNNPVYLNVLENNSLSFEGSQGQLLSISPDLNTGYVFTVGDISGIPLLRANANANITANEFGGNFGIGTTNPGYKLEVNGQTAITGSTSSISTSTGALIVTGGVGVGGSLNVGALSKFSDHLEIKGSGPKELRLYESGGAYYVALKAGAVASSSKTFTLPIVYGNDGEFLKTDGLGGLTWAAVTSGVSAVNAGVGLSVTSSTGSVTVKNVRPIVLNLASGFTPVGIGTDYNILRVPEGKSNNSANYNITKVVMGVGTTSSGTSTIRVEKSSGPHTGTIGFSLSSPASTTNVMSADLSLLSGLGETSWITFASGFGTAATGDRIRVNYTAVDSAHANFIVQMLLEEY
jgi:hypothetical protein